MKKSGLALARPVGVRRGDAKERVQLPNYANPTMLFLCFLTQRSKKNGLGASVGLVDFCGLKPQKSRLSDSVWS
jgi:hypothetical protein